MVRNKDTDFSEILDCLTRDNLRPQDICVKMTMEGLCGKDTCPQFTPEECIAPPGMYDD